MNRSAGFTLVEVMVALTIGALVVLVAHQVVVGVVDGAERVRAAREGIERRANAHRLLAEVLSNLEVGTDEPSTYDGRSGWIGDLERDELSFTSWVQHPHGWMERERMVLAVREGALLLSIGDRPILLADRVTALGIDHLLEPGADARWVAEWRSPVNAPLAVRVRVTRGAVADTMLYLVGSRG